ncbi:phospho-N-acetylmuramoyl-pentapeptide-transferase, partial (plasmid) [Chromobacterium amazonense]|nr:phospho-N-acetylmuramoyl-pentapeptide-transferase [Chromobacterium amazonense]
MLLWLADLLGSHIRAFNVFNYITLRAVMAALTSLTISLLMGPWVIRKLTELKVGQAVRNDGPQSHLVKAGTPTMGGSLILLSITLTTLLWSDLSNKYVWLLLA